MPQYATIILAVIGIISLIALFAGRFFTAIVGVALIGAGIYFFRNRSSAGSS